MGRGHPKFFGALRAHSFKRTPFLNSWIRPCIILFIIHAWPAQSTPSFSPTYTNYLHWMKFLRYAVVQVICPDPWRSVLEKGLGTRLVYGHLHTALLTFTQLRSIIERFKLCWRTFYDVPKKITLYHRQPQSHWSCHWSGHLYLLVISLLFRTFCVLLSLIIHVILTCGKKINGQCPENQHGQLSKRRKELVKVLTCGRSHDYGASDTPCYTLHGFDFSCSVLLFRWLTLLVIVTWTHTNMKFVLCIVVVCSFGISTVCDPCIRVFTSNTFNCCFQ